MKFLQKTGKASPLTFSQNALKITLVDAVGYTCLPCGPAETQKANSVTQLKPHRKAMGESPKAGGLSLLLGSMSRECYRLHQDQKEDNLRLWSPSYAFYADRQIHCLISCECICVHVLICVCVCGYIFTSMFGCAGQRSTSAVFLSQSPCYILRRSFSLNLELNHPFQTVQPKAILTLFICLPLQYSRLGGHAQL